MSDIYSNLTQLGGDTVLPTNPEDAVLERVQNPQADVDYNVRFTAPEFTSLCPMTGQPDFAHLVIDYVPGEWLVESKSLKLFLGSFRNHGAFHEDCTISIARRLQEFLEPRWLRIGGYWYPRRHPHRRVLADRRNARKRLDSRSGCAAISGPRLGGGLPAPARLPADPISKFLNRFVSLTGRGCNVIGAVRGILDLVDFRQLPQCQFFFDQV